MGEHVPVGRVGRPHGLEGAFVVDGASTDERRFAVGAAVHVGGRKATVVASRRAGRGKPAIRLDVPVERGEPLTVPRSDLPPAGNDEYYAFELIGLAVEEAPGGHRLGAVKEVLPGVANDNLVLDDGTLVPLIEDAVASVDLAGRRILLNPGFIG